MQPSPDLTNNTAEQEYLIKRLSKESTKDLALLHSEVYSTSVNEDYFIKKYDTAYTGIEYIGFVAYHKNGLPIAFYGVIPCFITFQSRMVLAAQSADTMTHPKHRYKGMFVDLSKKTFDLCKQNGIQLIFGFPNQNSYHGAVHKLGWKQTETMHCFTIATQAFPFKKILRVLRFGRLYNRYMRYVISKYSNGSKGVDNSVIADGFAGVYRNEDFFSYKKYNDTHVLIIGNSKIWISIKDSLNIGDMENITEKNFQMAIEGIRTIARKLGIRQIQFHCCKDTTLYNLFSNSSNSIPSFPVLFPDLNSSVPIENIKFTFADIDIF